MSLHLTISGSGKKAVAVYNDKLEALRPVLGKPDVTRASHVRYDPEREVWVAYCAESGDVLCEHQSRDQVIKTEVEILNKGIHKKLI
jgi:hypothetical protein